MKHISEAIEPEPTAVDAMPTGVTPVRLSDLDTSQPKVATAVETARRWQRLRLERPGLSLILVSTAVTDGAIEKAAQARGLKPDTPEWTAFQQRCWLTLTGNGVGKTRIAWALMWTEAYVVDGIPVSPRGLMFKAGDLVAKVGTRPMSQVLLGHSGQDGRMELPPVIAIDDVGTEANLQYVGAQAQDTQLQNKYFTIMDFCNDNKVSVIITANMTLDNLRWHLGPQAWSRLLEMVPDGFIVDLTGVPDYRVKKSGRI